MKFDEINPFVRFATKQTIYSSAPIVNFDRRFYYCLSGSGKITVNSKTYKIQKDTFIVWKAGSVYSYESDSDKGMEIVSANFDLSHEFSSESLPIPPVPHEQYDPSALLDEGFVFEDAVCLNDTIYIENALKLKEYVLSLQLEYNGKIKYSDLSCTTILQKILLECVRLVENDFHPSTESLVAEVLDFIQKNYKSNPTNEEIGLRFNYHPNYLNTLIVKYTGASIHNYLLTYKMNKALDLLVTTNLSIKEISFAIGIDDTQYFSRLFGQFFHKTPSSFRKK